jgi:transposase
MARPYSDDLRRKFLEAYEAGAGSLSKLAKQFRVSVQYAKKIRGQLKRTGRKERVEQSRYGAVSRVTEAARAALRQWLGEQSDLTAVELRERLAASGVGVSKSRVGQLLRQMGLRRKKNRSTRLSATTRKIARGGKRSSPRSPRSRRRS